MKLWQLVMQCLANTETAPNSYQTINLNSIWIFDRPNLMANRCGSGMIFQPRTHTLTNGLLISLKGSVYLTYGLISQSGLFLKINFLFCAIKLSRVGRVKIASDLSCHNETFHKALFSLLLKPRHYECEYDVWYSYFRDIVSKRIRLASALKVLGL